jgi:hypothetical protein
MDTTAANTHLVRWNVPFADWHEMSVWTIADGDFENFTVVVAPLSEKHPKDNYPKYLIRFESMIAFLTYEEAASLDRYGGHLMSLAGWVCGLGTYQWVNSPWARSCRGYAAFRAWEEPRHYLILGDDSIVEVISSHEPKIERVDAKRFIEVRHEV